MSRLLNIFVFCVATSTCYRVKQKTKEKRVVQSDSVGDPEWCASQIKEPSKCNNIQKISCPETCGLVEKTDTSNAPSKDTAKTKISFEAVSEDMSPIELAKVKKTDLYMRSWPKTCEGDNRFGDKIAGLDTNGFRCSESDGLVHEISSIAWRQPKISVSACCDGKCGHWKACGKEPHTFAEAAAATLSRSALELDHIVTDQGRKVQINVEVASEEKAQATGVQAEVEVRMMQRSLEFVSADYMLTDAGETFLLDLASALGPLVSMQMAAFAVEPKVVLCVHAETTATFEGLRDNPTNKELGTELPLARAQEVRYKLEGIVPADVASLGAPSAHFDQERPDYRTGRRAFIIYKLYDPSFPEPACEQIDLYPFVDKYADADEH